MLLLRGVARFTKYLRVARGCGRRLIAGATSVHHEAAYYARFVRRAAEKLVAAQLRLAGLSIRVT